MYSHYQAVFQKNNLKNCTGVILTNTGTPDYPTPISIRKYLKEFLSDKRIIKLPRFIWLPILYLFILNIRPSIKSNDYKKIWMENGSPLLVITKKLLDLLKKYNTSNVIYSIAMRYGNPSIRKQLNEFKDKGIKKILILPMFPQYSYSTTESIKDEVFNSLKKLKWNPEIQFINEYYKEKLFIDANINMIKNIWKKQGKSQLIIFSYHGLPKKYVNQGDPYYSSCLKTTKLIVDRLQLKNQEFITSFHSKFGFGEWTKPYTEDLLKELPNKGKKNISIISPTFSIDCLETLEEINIQFKESFIKSGGEKFTYIPCLNNSLDHMILIQHLVKKNLK